MQNDFQILDELSPIGMEGMDSIRLMNRTDRKYLTDLNTLKVVLTKAAANGYSVFETSGLRIQEYRSMYYDTPELQMYLDHHNRRLVRQKLRTRCYHSSGKTFLEVKSKNNHGRTKKKRMEIEPDCYWKKSLDEQSMVSWLEGKTPFQINTLSPSLETAFSRITLVNPERTERSTIDFDLHFNNVRKGTSSDMGNLVIIEVKQDANLPSKLRDILLECRIKPIRISKYCIGTAMTDDTVRSGRFKHKIIMINKLKAQ